MIGAVLAVAAGSFLYVGGFLSSDRLTPKWGIDALEQASGAHAGFRRNHAKGVCIIRSFASNGQGQRLFVRAECGHADHGAILPRDASLYAGLRLTHTVLALPDDERK